MDKQALSKAMKPWIAANTWHTGHPCDEKRFNLSVRSAILEVGRSITTDIWREVFTALVHDLHPGFDADEAARLIEEYASKAGTISAFLSDTDQL